MRSLFLKIFISFLSIILMVTISVLVLTALRDQEFPPLPHQHFARTAINKYGQDALRIYEQQGIEHLKSYAEQLHQRSGIYLAIFDDQLTPLSHEKIPQRLQHMAARALRSGEVVFPRMGPRNGLAATIQRPSGRQYVVTLLFPERQPTMRNLTHGFLGHQLLLLLAVSALVCYLLARSLSTPIKRLRQATHRLAEGEFSIRVGEQIQGKTEIAALARDFDHMAARIERLVHSQQRLLRDVSHELRSPLTRLGIALELAKDQPSASQRERGLARIELEAQRMNTMIGELLTLCRLDARDISADFQTINLCELFKQIIEDAKFEAESRHCRIEACIESNCLFYGSAELMKQALENVIRNAVRYSTEGTQIDVTLKSIHHAVTISIRDRGPGVPETSLDKLFDPFYRVAEARERETGGSGIGLAITERSIHLHGGKISASNHPDGGLVIQILLPGADKNDRQKA